MKRSDKIIYAITIFCILSPFILVIFLYYGVAVNPGRYNGINDVLNKIDYANVGPIQEDRKRWVELSPAQSIRYSDGESAEILRERIVEIPEARCTDSPEARELHCTVRGVSIDLTWGPSTSYLFLIGEY